MSIISVPRDDPIKTSFVSEAEKILAKAVKKGDFDRGFAVINELYEQAEAFAEIIGTGFNMMEKAWDKFEHEEGDSFFNAAVRNTRLNPVTIRNRINVSELLRSGRIPKTYKEQIKDLGQKSLIRIANTAKSKYTITKEDWEKFAESTNEQEVDAIARDIENKKPRSNFVGFFHDGLEIKVYTRDKVVGIYGVLNPEDEIAKMGRKVLHARGGVAEKVTR